MDSSSAFATRYCVVNNIYVATVERVCVFQEQQKMPFRYVVNDVLANKSI